MKIGKTFHLIASIISAAAILTMFLPIAGIAGAVNMFQSALGLNCDATWSNSVILIMQLIIIIFDIVIFVSAGKKYANYNKVKFIRVIQIVFASIMTLLAFATLAIIGVPSGSGISVGPGPIFFGICYLVVIVFIVLSFVYLNKPEVEHAKVSNKVDKTENENIDLLLKYKELYNKKIITKAEFEKKKKELLKK